MRKQQLKSNKTDSSKWMKKSTTSKSNNFKPSTNIKVFEKCVIISKLKLNSLLFLKISFEKFVRSVVDRIVIRISRLEIRCHVWQARERARAPQPTYMFFNLSCCTIYDCYFDDKIFKIAVCRAFAVMFLSDINSPIL